MGACPKCRYEYQPHVRVCADCGSELVPLDQLPSLDPVDPALVTQQVVSAHRAADEPELRRVRAALEAEGIQAFVHSFEVSMFDDVFKEMPAHLRKQRQMMGV